MELSVFFKEVDYKYTYNNTLRYVLKRKYKGARVNIERLDIDMFFWYRQIASEDVALIKLYNNMMLLWFLFDKKSTITNYDSTLRRGVYYYRLILTTDFVPIEEKFTFLDVFVNGVMPLMRMSTISFYLANKDIIVKLSDMSLFSNTRMGEFFYVENVTDKLHLRFAHIGRMDIKQYINVFKININ